MWRHLAAVGEGILHTKPFINGNTFGLQMIVWYMAFSEECRLKRMFSPAMRELIFLPTGMMG